MLIVDQIDIEMYNSNQITTHPITTTTTIHPKTKNKVEWRRKKTHTHKTIYLYLIFIILESIKMKQNKTKKNGMVLAIQFNRIGTLTNRHSSIDLYSWGCSEMVELICNNLITRMCTLNWFDSNLTDEGTKCKRKNQQHETITNIVSSDSNSNNVGKCSK